jgi:hypothetical protein
MTLAYARLSYRIGLLAGAIRYAARGAAGEAQADSLMEVVRYRSTHGMLTPELVQVVKTIALGIPGVNTETFQRAEALYEDDISSMLLNKLIEKAVKEDGNGR